MFYDKFLALCIKKNMSPSAAAIDAGFSNAAAAGWKKGAVPRGSAIKKLADYFGVPVSYFSEDTETPPTSSTRIGDIAKMYDMLTPERQKKAFDSITALLIEQLQE